MDMAQQLKFEPSGEEMIVDFHSHILPAIDDGSRNIHESVEMLRVRAQQGVSCLIATPHFYPHRIGLTEFLNNRERAYNEISSCKLEGIPFIKCGAEVTIL